MLQTIREATQGWIAGVIISIICLTFALWGIHSYFVGGGASTTVAEVNGKEITKNELTVAYERLRRQNAEEYNKSESGLNDSELKKEALDSLIELEVLKQASVAQGFLISDQQVDAYLQSMPEFQVNGEFSLDKFQQAMSSSLLSTAGFLELIKTSLLINQPRFGVSLTSFTTPQEVQHLMALVDEERDIEYLPFTDKQISKNEMVITQADIKNYYNDNKTSFMTPEQINVHYVELTLSGLSAKIKPTDTMLRHYYNENINAYTKPMAWKLEEIRVPMAESGKESDVSSAKLIIEDIEKSLEKGADFAALAKQHQSDQSYLGQHLVTLNMLPASLQDAVSRLSKAGEHTKPIKLSDAFVILKATEVRAPGIDSFESVKSRVQEDYVRQHAEEKFAELRERLADLSYERPESLDEVSNQLGLPQKVSAFFSKDKGGNDLTQYQKVRDIAFTPDVLELKNNSDVVQLTPEAVAVIRINQHHPSSLQPLSAVSQEIIDKLRASRGDDRLKGLAENLKAKLDSGAKMEEIAHQHQLAWQNMGYIGRYSTRVDSAILDKAFRLPNPDKSKLSATYGVTKTPTGYAIVALKHVKPGATTDKDKTRVFAEQAQNSEGSLEYILYKNSQMERAKIKMVE